MARGPHEEVEAEDGVPRRLTLHVSRGRNRTRRIAAEQMGETGMAVDEEFIEATRRSGGSHNAHVTATNRTSRTSRAKMARRTEARRPDEEVEGYTAAVPRCLTLTRC